MTADHRAMLRRYADLAAALPHVVSCDSEIIAAFDTYSVALSYAKAAAFRNRAGTYRLCYLPTGRATRIPHDYQRDSAAQAVDRISAQERIARHA